MYNLQKQFTCRPGATLTIEAGTLVQSTAGLGGSLAVCRGAKIYVNGTKEAPVIMTSTKDDLKHWHEGCNEWGNLTIMGNALISCSQQAYKPVTINGHDQHEGPGRAESEQHGRPDGGLPGRHQAVVRRQQRRRLQRRAPLSVASATAAR